MLGLLTATADERYASLRVSVTLDDNTIVSRIAARSAARGAKDFAEADRLRAELEAMGIQLMDRKDPATGEVRTEWEVKR